MPHTYHPSFQEAGEHAGTLGTYQLVRPTPLGGVVAYAPMLQGELGRALGSRECIYSGLVGSVDEGIGEKVEVITDGSAQLVGRRWRGGEHELAASAVLRHVQMIAQRGTSAASPRVLGGYPAHFDSAVLDADQI